jgi:hypothetical protein
MLLYTTTVLEISIGYYFIISKPTRFSSLKMRKNVPNNGQSIAEDMTSNARHFLPVHLVRYGTWLYVLQSFDTFWYVIVRLVRFHTFSYVMVSFWYVGMPRRIFLYEAIPTVYRGELRSCWDSQQISASTCISCKNILYNGNALK